MLGMHGSAYANPRYSFCDRVTGKVDSFSPAVRVAGQQGPEGSYISKLCPRISIQANIPAMGDVVSDLRPLVPGVRFNERKEWFDTIRGWKKS